MEHDATQVGGQRTGDAERGAGSVPLEGGRLCLDFVNTLDWRGTAEPVELLRGYADLLAWGVHAGWLAPRAAAALERIAAAHPAAAERTLAGARALREALHRLFTGGVFSAGDDTAADLALLAAALPGQVGGLRVGPGKGGARWTLSDPASGDPGVLAEVVRPVAYSAAALLTDPELARVKACADAACGWLFLDGSRAGRRRWCSMAGCGNRAKARRHYRKRKGAKPASA